MIADYFKANGWTVLHILGARRGEGAPVHRPSEYHRRPTYVLTPLVTRVECAVFSPPLMMR